jgi:hypothetical protein
MQVTVSVDGEDHPRDIEPRLLLVHFLGDELGPTGTHWGCDTSSCGTCVVPMDGDLPYDDGLGHRRRHVGRLRGGPVGGAPERGPGNRLRP